MRFFLQFLLGIASFSFNPPAGAADSDVRVVVYKGPTDCTDEDKVLPGNYISIHFNGYIDESSDVGDRGMKFISSRDMNQTADFQIGKRKVIKGWDRGLLGLCKGSSAMLVTPPDLAYGQLGGEPGIPGGATLLFDIEIIGIQNCPPPTSTDPDLKPVEGEDAEEDNLHGQECPASSTMSSHAYEDEEEEELGVATTFSRSKPPRRGGKHNKRLKKKSKKKVQETITFLTSPVWCSNPDTSPKIEPRIESVHKCQSSCSWWCDWCCSSDCKKGGSIWGFGGRCYCPSMGAYCPSGYSNDGYHIECHDCVMDDSRPPGYESIADPEGNVDSSEVSSLGSRTGCPYGYICRDQTVYCSRKCDQHSFPEIFPQHCRVGEFNYCAKSKEICNDKHWEFLQIWGDFFLNFIPGGGQTVKGLARAAKTSKNYRELNRALRRVGRNALKKMKNDFKKEMKNLKKDLKEALKEEVDAVVDGVIDDALEEMSLKASQEDQDDSELGEVVLKALGDFVVDFFSPFDFKGMKALMDGPNCDRYSISSADLEWEDLPDGLQNVAHRKPAKQSSRDKGTANLAVDGNLDGDYHAGSVTHTDFLFNQWWEVDLQQLYTIVSINVYNREDCCGGRLAGFRVEIFEGNTVKWTKTMPNTTPDYETIIDVPSIHGDRVRVSLPNKTEYLQLTEVEVISPGLNCLRRGTKCGWAGTKRGDASGCAKCCKGSTHYFRQEISSGMWDLLCS